MKRLYYSPMLILIASFFVISCSKESALLGTNLIPATADQLPVGSEIGSIVDLGLINTDTRVMQTILNVQNFLLNGSGYGDISDVSATLSLTYYVGADAQIPAGVYAFSNSDAKSPFTFDSAIVVNAVDANGNLFVSEKIVDGSVTVTQDGGSYEFQFQGHLESGATFAGDTKGSVKYSDNNIYTGNNMGNGM